MAAYSILQDLAVQFFAFAAVDAASWGPGRTWLLVIAVAKTALLGWKIVAARTFGTRSLADLRGWARGGLLLALAFGVIAAATVGIPGFASFGARVDLVEGALAPPIGTLVLLLSLSTLLVHGRVLAIGLLEPTVIVRAADDERLRRLPPDLRRESETARQTLDLNRAPVAAAIVAVLALVAFSASAGLFRLDSAAAEDVPAALPGAQPTFGPVATFEPVPTESPPGSVGVHRSSAARADEFRRRFSPPGASAQRSTSRVVAEQFAGGTTARAPRPPPPDRPRRGRGSARSRARSRRGSCRAPPRAGWVAPFMSRTTGIAFGPSRASATSGARRDEVDQAREERLLAMRRVVPLGERRGRPAQLQPDDLEAAFLVAGEDAAVEQALDAVGLDEDEGAFGHSGLLRWWSGSRRVGRPAAA